MNKIEHSCAGGTLHYALGVEQLPGLSERAPDMNGVFNTSGMELTRAHPVNPHQD